MQTQAAFRETFAKALPFPQYLSSAKPHERANWEASFARVTLKPEQTALIRSFTRRVNILVISGTWCGDCVQQCPILARFEEAQPAVRADEESPGIDLRFIDRDVHAAFAAPFKICGGQRVPAAIFLSEEFDFISIMGDKTLSKLRSLAQRSLGAACALPSAAVPVDELGATVQDWLNELERVALLLRLSAKLREKHAD